MEKYENAWPVTLLMRQYINNHRQYQQKVEGEDPQAENPPVGQDSTDDSDNEGGDSSSGLPVSSA